MNFYTGFLAGILLKDHAIKIFEKIITNPICVFHKINKPKTKNMEKRAFLVCKIVDLELFDEHFPVLNTKSRVQPSWEYSKTKQTIKIELTDIDFTNPVDFVYFLEKTGIDIDFFETFCELSIYVHYFVDNREYINIYQPGQTILPIDFELSETELVKRYQNLICAIFNNGQEIYITRYFKMFLNNRYQITIEQILIYNDIINELNGTLKLVDGKLIKVQSIKEII